MDYIYSFIRNSFVTSYDIKVSGSPQYPLRHFITVDISGTDFEVPVILADYISSLKRAGYTEAVFPFSDNIYTMEKKSVRGVINALCSGIVYDIPEIQVRENEIYRGCYGLILDKESNPLLLLTVKLHFNAETNSCKATKCICRIPSSIMERQDELIPKTIYKKVIPLLATTYIGNVYIEGVRQSSVSYKKVDIIMSTDCNVVFHTVAPKPSDANDETFNNIIKKALEE